MSRKSDYRSKSAYLSVKDIPIETLRNYFNYYPESGVIERAFGQFAGPISSLSKHGYIRTDFKGFNLQAHHLAWVLHYGKWPEDCIDHIDGDKTNNRISNLRELSHRENLANNPRYRATGIPAGCKRLESGKWTCRLHINGIEITLPKKETLEEIIHIRQLVIDGIKP